jgi:hypothetical protein
MKEASQLGYAYHLSSMYHYSSIIHNIEILQFITASDPQWISHQTQIPVYKAAIYTIYIYPATIVIKQTIFRSVSA